MTTFFPGTTDLEALRALQASDEALSLTPRVNWRVQDTSVGPRALRDCREYLEESARSETDYAEVLAHVKACYPGFVNAGTAHKGIVWCSERGYLSDYAVAYYEICRRGKAPSRPASKAPARVLEQAAALGRLLVESKPGVAGVDYV